MANSGICFNADSEVILTTMAGKQSTVKAENTDAFTHNAVSIPAGFEGYILIPSSSLICFIDASANLSEFNGQPLDTSKLTLYFVGINVGGIDEARAAFDNFLLN